MVTVIPCSINRCSIEFQLGNTYTIHHLKPEMVHGFVLNTLKDAILRFCRQTLQDLDANPRCPKIWDRTSHGNAFQYSISRMAEWDADRLTRHIQRKEQMMLKMLPHTTSPNYRKLSQLAFDIIIICTQNINEL